MLSRLSSPHSRDERMGCHRIQLFLILYMWLYRGGRDAQEVGQSPPRASPPNIATQVYHDIHRAFSLLSRMNNSPGWDCRVLPSTVSTPKPSVTHSHTRAPSHQDPTDTCIDRQALCCIAFLARKTPESHLSFPWPIHVSEPGACAVHILRDNTVLLGHSQRFNGLPTHYSSNACTVNGERQCLMEGLRRVSPVYSSDRWPSVFIPNFWCSSLFMRRYPDRAWAYVVSMLIAQTFDTPVCIEAVRVDPHCHVEKRSVVLLNPYIA